MVAEKRKPPLTKLVGCGRPLYHAVRWKYKQTRREYELTDDEILHCGVYLTGSFKSKTSDFKHRRPRELLCEGCLVRNGFRW